MTTVEHGGAHRGGKREGVLTQTILRECRKEKEERGRELKLSEDLRTFLLGQFSCV